MEQNSRLVQPGGNLNNVQISYSGIDGLTVTESAPWRSKLFLGNSERRGRESINKLLGSLWVVDGRFKLTGDKSYTFDVGTHSARSLSQIHDAPYSTFIGGSNSEAAAGIAVDSSVALT